MKHQPEKGNEQLEQRPSKSAALASGLRSSIPPVTTHLREVNALDNEAEPRSTVARRDT
jgi:hypothetical protein